MVYVSGRFWLVMSHWYNQRFSYANICFFKNINSIFLLSNFFHRSLHQFILPTSTTLFKSTEFTQCCLYIHEYRAMQWYMDSLSGVNPNDYPLPSALNCQWMGIILNCTLNTCIYSHLIVHSCLSSQNIFLAVGERLIVSTA